MGIAGSPDIFQAKMSELLIALEYVRTYLDDLLIITKASLSDHLVRLKKVLTRLREAGLKVNADKSKFCAHCSRDLVSLIYPNERWNSATN